MLQAWLSIGYIVVLAILVLAFIIWRRESPVPVSYTHLTLPTIYSV